MPLSQEVLQKLEEVETEIAHLIADALFLHMKSDEKAQEVQDANNI